jgi:hypothetical protein
MNAFNILAAHHAKHIYKRGINIGDAPLAKRSKTHLRILKYPTHYAVLFHRTEILTAYPDGSVVLNCNGYIRHPTTQDAMNTALNKCFTGLGVSHSRRFNYSQPSLYRYTYGRRAHFLYYDGMTLDSTGAITSPLQGFERKQMDKAAIADFVKGMQESGFKDVFKVLHAVSEGGRNLNLPRSTSQAITDEVYANSWADIVAYYTWEMKWERDPTGNPYAMKRALVKNTASKAWASLMRACKKDMTEVVRTDVTEIT